jgi:hypothetical protein
VCYLGEALALATVAWAATSGHLEVAVLAAAGLLLGTAEALDGRAATRCSPTSATSAASTTL